MRTTVGQVLGLALEVHVSAHFHARIGRSVRHAVTLVGEGIPVCHGRGRAGGLMHLRTWHFRSVAASARPNYPFAFIRIGFDFTVTGTQAPES
jgi:hypothetical protein